MDNSDVIDLIKSRLSIVDVVGKDLELSRRGNQYWACCPFHNEKTPSFSLNQENNYYHCFGCGKSGDIFNYIMEREHLSFPDALEKLAKLAGVNLEKKSKSNINLVKDKRSIYEIYERLTKTFNYILLNSDSAKAAREYLKTRGISEKSIEDFKIGYAPSDPKWLYSFLIKNGYDSKILTLSGLFSKNYKKYPLFVNRIMFPITDIQNRVLAFGARALSENDKAKYINSSESLIYSKKNNVLGIYEGLADLKKGKRVILCEGNFDVITLYQAGLGPAVAPLGTAFTENQAFLLKRYTNEVIILFDSDEAGINATIKAASLLAKVGFNIRALSLKGAKDPSELLKKMGQDELVKQVENAKEIILYLVTIAKNKYNTQGSFRKDKIVNFLKGYVHSISSEITKDEVIKIIAEQLDLDLASVKMEINKINTVFSNENDEDVGEINLKMTLGFNLLLILINNREYMNEVFRELEPKKDFIESHELEILFALKEARDKDVLEDDKKVVALIKDRKVKALVIKSFSNDSFKRDAKGSIDFLLREIKLRRLDSMSKEIREYLNLSHNDAEKDELLRQLCDIDNQIQNLRESR